MFSCEYRDTFTRAPILHNTCKTASYKLQINLSEIWLLNFKSFAIYVCVYRSSQRPTTLLKKRPWHRCFPMNFAKFLRTPFLQNTCNAESLVLISNQQVCFIMDVLLRRVIRPWLY